MAGLLPHPGVSDVWWIDRAREARRRDDDAPVDVTLADALRSTVRRTRFLAGRRAVRRILASYLEVAPAVVPISVRTDGRPTLPDDYGLTFSISHCGFWTVLAVSAGATIGIDAVDYADFAHAGLEAVSLVASTRERVELQVPGGDQSLQRRLWVRKEAVGKALGAGLLLDLQAIEVGHGDAAKARAVQTPRGAFHIMDCPAPTHVTAALCASPPLDAIRLRDAAGL